MAEIGRIDQTADPECPTITLVGEFDLSNAPDLVRRFDELADASVPRVIIDMTETSFIDSTVLGAFGLAYRRGLHLTIRGASDVVRRHLDSSGLAAIFDIE
jgi:anti-sigma B factor antagonist